MRIPKEFGKLRRLFNRQEKFKILLLLVMMLVAALLEVIGIGMIPAFVSIVANPQRVLEHATWGPIINRLGIEGSRELLVYGSSALILVFIVKNLYVILFRYVEARFIFNRRYLFGHRLMTAYMQAPYPFFLQRNTNELLRNINEEVNLLINKVLAPLMKITKESVMALAVVIFLLTVEPLITLFVLFAMGLTAGLFLVFTQRRIKGFGKEAQRCRKDMLQAARQGFSGIKDARVTNREGYFIEVFRNVVLRFSRLQMMKKFISDIPRPVIETVAVGGIMAIALIMYLQGRPIADIIPIIALFSVATVRLMPAIEMMASNLTDLRYNMAAVNPVHDDLTGLKPVQKTFKADRMKNHKVALNDAIRFNNVHYQYPNSRAQALNGISLGISKGKAVAFVGPSGAGKSTIVDVLLGLLHPQEGEVLVDEKNTFDNISAWQRNIGYIPQFIYLMDDSIRRNIAFGVEDEDINEERIRQSVVQAQLADLVAELPDGLDTVIGERGARLSGGQRQRIGIARALYHDPQVLVMDEATSALDNITEQHIIEAIEALKGERTIIMIAHRLTTVMNCDVLYMMDQGKIIDQGTYKELLDRNEGFREMTREGNEK